VVRGEVCLIWQNEDEAGLTCWPAEEYGRYVVKTLNLRAAGAYTVWVASGKIVSNTVTVEVR
jgi:hypothetical protein